MPKRPDISAYKSFDDICGRLDDIIDVVRAKDTSLERSLDLFDEAIALGSAAVELVDVTELSEAEAARLEATQEQASETAGGEASAAPSGDAGAA
jgi:predicted RNA-binding protein associated with RNAse of E/G family